jgi:glycosyltransferase involved in cell wall biosynthesis
MPLHLRESGGSPPLPLEQPYILIAASVLVVQLRSQRRCAMRIAELLLRPTIGGAETLASSLAALWRDQGHDVAVLYLDPPGKPSGRVARVLRLRRSLDRLRPDVVHAHSALPNLYARVSSRGRWPVVTVLHSATSDFGNRQLRWSEKLLQPWTAAVIAVTESERAEYLAMVKGKAPKLIPNGLRMDLRQRVAANAHPSKAVAVGRIAAQKRMDVLLEGWQRAALQDWRLIIAGVAAESRTQTDFRTLVARSGPSVQALGAVDDIPALLADCDLFVHTADHEAHPLAPLEAAGSGLPVVVSDAVAVTLPVGLPAGVFRTGDPDSLALTLRAVVEHYDAVAVAAMQWAPKIRSQFSLADCAAHHLEVLRDAMQGGMDANGWN